MNKKGNGNPVVIFIILIIVALALGIINIPVSSEKVSTASLTTETIKETYYVPSSSASERQNLCTAFQPIIDAGDPDTTCNSLGGTWTCQSDIVGCYGVPTSSISCSGTGWAYLFQQCVNLGGEYVCNGQSAVCYYR